MIRSRPFLEGIVFRHEPVHDEHGHVVGRRPVERVEGTYTPRDTALRVDHHRPSRRAWPIRLTRCGEDPGRYGDVDRCGDHAPWPSHPDRSCVHEPGHFPDTWHRSPGGVEWDYSEPPTSPGSIARSRRPAPAGAR